MICSAPNVVVATCRVDTHTDPMCAPDIYENFESLETEACAVRGGATPLVCTVIDCVVEELLDKISVRSMHYSKDKYEKLLGSNSNLNHAELLTLDTVEARS